MKNELERSTFRVHARELKAGNRIVFNDAIWDVQSITWKDKKCVLSLSRVDESNKVETSEIVADAYLNLRRYIPITPQNEPIVMGILEALRGFSKL